MKLKHLLAIALLFMASMAQAEDPYNTCEIPPSVPGGGVSFNAMSGWCALRAAQNASFKSDEICRSDCTNYTGNVDATCMYQCINKVFGEIYLTEINDCRAEFNLPPWNGNN